MNPLILPSFDSPSSGVTAWRGNLYPQDVDNMVNKIQDIVMAVWWKTILYTG